MTDNDLLFGWLLASMEFAVFVFWLHRPPTPSCRRRLSRTDCCEPAFGADCEGSDAD